MTTTTEDKINRTAPTAKKKPRHWVVYIAALLAGFLLLADAVQYGPGIKISARLGIGLVYSAFAFLFIGLRPSSYIGAILLWVVIVLTFVF